MKIAILGAGFTGLTTALELAKLGHGVTVFEKESDVGGLASGFKKPEWSWYLDKMYHHFFTNDTYAINLAKEVGINLIKKKPKTNVLVNNQILPFDSPVALLKFPHLPFTDRLRVGFLTFYLKYLSNPSHLSNLQALPWLRKYMGEKATNLIWEPLFLGKFGEFKDKIALTWFWARIKKRSTSLLYPEGGFYAFAKAIQKEAEKLGVKFIFNHEIHSLSPNDKRYTIHDMQFDKVISTLPTQVFTKLTKFPPSYAKRLNSISHLSALNLILELKKPFFKNNTYWLNITDNTFPFLVMAEHTNFMKPKYYGKKHLLYIGCYLPNDHPYLKMSPKKLLKIFSPYLKQINPNYTLDAKRSTLFSLPNAQPVVTPDYLKYIPKYITPVKNLYLANMDMVYPWDRGVNYAIELGLKTAKLINNGKLNENTA